MGKIRTRVGRIVWGNPQKAQQKKDNDKNPAFKDGKAVMQWACGVAFPKAEFQTDIWPEMSAETARLFPQGAPNKYAWKWVDGDGMPRQSKIIYPNNDTTTILLSNVQKNVTLKAEIFKLKYPKTVAKVKG